MFQIHFIQYDHDRGQSFAFNSLILVLFLIIVACFYLSKIVIVEQIIFTVNFYLSRGSEYSLRCEFKLQFLRQTKKERK